MGQPDDRVATPSWQPSSNKLSVRELRCLAIEFVCGNAWRCARVASCERTRGGEALGRYRSFRHHDVYPQGQPTGIAGLLTVCLAARHTDIRTQNVRSTASIVAHTHGVVRLLASRQVERVFDHRSRSVAAVGDAYSGPGCGSNGSSERVAPATSVHARGLVLPVRRRT